MQTFKLFVSSPGDVMVERRRVESVVSRLNGEFAGVVRLEVIRWETEFYQAYSTFQAQIPRSTDCDLVIGILKWRLGTELPPDFAETLPNGQPFPSGTAYEILTAIEKRQKGAELPDVFVFRFSGSSPSVAVEDPKRAKIEHDWQVLKGFFQEWFLTERGHFKAAFNPYNSEDDFGAQLEQLLRNWVADKVAGGRVVRWPIAVKGSPFRGLGAFGAKHAPVFFGRSHDTARAVDLWREAGSRVSPYLLVVGASGSGKSSLARAGLVPRLTTPGVIREVDVWRTAVMRPGDSPIGPFAALAEALMQDEAGLPKEEEGRGPALPEIGYGDSRTSAELAAVLRHAAAAAIKPIVNALSRVAAAERDRDRYGREVRCDLVLLIDQLDELFVTSVSQAERIGFIDLIAALVATGRIWVVATLRADLYSRMLAQPALKKLKDMGATYDLAPPGPVELAEIVRAPADAAGLVYGTDASTGENLDARLLRDADRPDMLPLVQLALSRLFEGRETVGDEIRLPLKIYEGLGGLKGIVNEAGETALASLGEAEKARLPRLLRLLAVPAHGQDGAVAGALTIRAVPLGQAVPDDSAHRLLDALVTARLLTTSGIETDAQVRLAHQRVLEDWVRASAIVAESADFYRIRADLEKSCQKWETGNRRSELLLARGLPLAEAESIAGKYGDELAPAVLAYVRASRTRANRAQMVGWGSAAVFALVAIGAGIAATVAFEQRTAAEAARVQAEQETQRADSNFTVAKQTVDGLIFNIAQGLRGVTGMRIDTVREILDTVQKTIDQLTQSAPDDPQLLRSRSVMFGNFVDTYLAAGDLQDAAAAASQSLDIARKLAARDPGNAQAQRDLSLILDRLGDVKSQGGDGVAALAAYQESLDISRKLAAQAPDKTQAQRDVSVSLEKLGDVKLQGGDGVGALAAYQESLDIVRKLAAQDQGNAQAQRDVSVSLNKLGDLKLQGGDGAGALSAYQESLDIRRKLAAQDPGNAQAQRDLSVSLDNLGDVKLQSGDQVGALATYQESLDIRSKLAAQDPGNAQSQRDVSVSLDNLGEVKLQGGDGAGALSAYQESLDIRRKLAAQDLGNAQAQRDLSVSLNKLGNVKLQGGDGAGALATYQESLDIVRKLAAQDPGDAQAQRDVSVSLEELGDVKLQGADGAGALAAYQESLDIRRTIAAQDLGNADAQRDVAVGLTKLGDAKLTGGDGIGALAAYQESLDIRRKLAAQEQDNAQAQADLVVSLYKTSIVLDPSQARAALTEALSILQKLDQEQKLTAAQRDWPNIVRTSLSKLP
jgi:tetratricopeptide (TPR) repeat protein